MQTHQTPSAVVFSLAGCTDSLHCKVGAWQTFYTRNNVWRLHETQYLTNTAFTLRPVEIRTLLTREDYGLTLGK